MSTLKTLTGLALASSVILLPLAAQSLETRTALHGHVIGRLKEATRLPRSPQSAQEPITFCVILNLLDPAGAEAFRQAVNDPDSPQYRTRITPFEFTSRFGPTQQAYDAVLNYLQKNGFTLVVGSDNRRTLTVRGTRVQAEGAFRVSIDDYKLGERTFHAIAAEPSLPTDLAPLVASITGLSNLAQWRPAASPFPNVPASIAAAYNGTLTPAGKTNTGGLPPGLDGSGQNLGLIEFDGFNPTDVQNWLSNAGLPSKLISQVSVTPINGGTTPSGCSQTSKGCGTTEVLLDIAAALGMAPGANITVFEAPPDTDFATAANWAINTFSYTGGTLSLSWAICEGEISSSDATSMDSSLADAALFGVTLFAATGDNGSTCVDGSGNSYANNISFPADVPHAVAVGGTVLNVGAANAYNTESYWSKGGYGVSEFIGEPGYQSSLYSGAGGRSVPDVSAEAGASIVICQATPSKSPDCGAPSGGKILLWGGTSLSTPIWAATWALASQARADAGGVMKPPVDGYFYKIPEAFHSASSMTGAGNNFAHVGLGSPDITTLIAKYAPPQVDSINPYEGPGSGGTKVTITGAGFIGVKKVTFGGVDAGKLTIVSDTELTVETPEAADSNASVEVFTPGGSAKAASLYTYYPEIQGVGPSSGSAAGGTHVTVTGLALGNAAHFQFGSAVATSVSCSSSKCTMESPAETPGTVDIIALTPWGYGNSTPNSKDKFTYDSPSITSILPGVGPTTGGVPVTITGVSLVDGKTHVNLGGTVVTKVVCTPDGVCGFTSPAHAAGSVPVTVTVDGITSPAAKSEFQFVVFPTVTGISKSSGAAGDTVTFTGTGFSTTPGQTTFTFTGLSLNTASSVSCSSTKCTAVVPVQGSSTAVSITATVNGNTSLDSVDFTYTTVPVTPPPPCKGTMCN